MGLVFEVVFEGFNCLICYKLGFVMCFLCIYWLWWDKLFVEVDELMILEMMMDVGV